MPREKAHIARIRERRCVELAFQNVPYEQIAEEVGYSSPSGVSNAIKRYYERNPISVNPEELRQRQVARIEELIGKLWKTATLDLTDDDFLARLEQEIEDAPAAQLVMRERAAELKAVAREANHAKAADTIRKLLEREAKLLGLDAPTKFEGETTLTTTDAVMSALDALAGVKPTEDDDQGQ